MIRNCRVAADVASLSPLLAPPQGSAAGVAPITAALRRARQMIEESRRARRSPPGGGGAPQEPDEEHAARRSILNDPHFWMLMIH
jgi:hypothetical protein